MTDSTQSLSRPAAPVRAALGITVLTLAALAGSTGSVLAASVEPTEIDGGNPTCADFDPTWNEVKADPVGDGSYSDGTVTITISDFVNSSSGNPGSFDWSSDAPISAVFVKAGSDKHHLYVYDPAVMGDTELGPQTGSGNGISHISFCYGDPGETEDEPEPTPTPDDPEPTPTPTPDDPEPTPTPDDPEPTPTPDEPEGGVEPATGTPRPQVTLPPTDALPVAGEAVEDGSALGLVLIVGSLLGLASFVVGLRPARER